MIKNDDDDNGSAPTFLSFPPLATSGEFWCQLLSDAARLEQLMDYLQNLYRANQLKPISSWPPAILDTIAAQFPTDEAWYRGVVVRVEDNKAEVGYVFLSLLVRTSIHLFVCSTVLQGQQS